MSKDAEQKTKAYIRLMGDPYASLSIYDQTEDAVSAPSLRDRRKLLQNPFAFVDVLEDNEVESKAPQRLTQPSLEFTTKPKPEKPSPKPELPASDLDGALDRVLRTYKPYVARGEWAKVEEFRPVFLGLARKSPTAALHLIKKLSKLNFALLPGERVEHNRAPAQKIISELEAMLTDLE